MTDYKISQLAAAVPASADLIPFVDVDDTSTPPAGAGGSDKAATAANLAAVLATLAPAYAPAGFRSVSTSTAATSGDFLIECTAALTVTLPTSAIPAGLLLVIKKTGSGNVTIAPATGTIDGAASILLVNPSDVVLAQWDGTTWIVVGGTRVPGWLSASSGIHSGGVLTSGSNTLDDGSGNAAIAGNLAVTGTITGAGIGGVSLGKTYAIALNRYMP